MTDKIIHPSIKDSRVLTYLNKRNKPQYQNTKEESLLLSLWREKYILAKEEYEKSRANSKKVESWRKAFEGDFYQLDSFGQLTNKKMKAIRKLAFELIENKVNSHIPAPKMSPRYYSDLVPVAATENLIKHNIDKMLSEDTNDKAEHHALIDSATWFKVSWDPFDNTHERSGNPRVTVCPIDTVFPQPGIVNYKDLEYIFEETNITIAQALDLYAREIQSPSENDIIPIVNCYFLNEDRYVGKFTWCDENSIVLCNDLEWGIRRRRECSRCGEITNIENECRVCGGKIHYVPVKEDTLTEPLEFVKNPYRINKTQDKNEDHNQLDEERVIPENTVIPHYLIRQLPFVPYKRINVPNSIYGMSEVEVISEDQDLINKLLNKAEKKSAKSKTYVTKLKDTYISNKDDEISLIEVDSPQEGQAIQVKQIQSDIVPEVTQAQFLYEMAKSTVGVTDTDQGKNDPSARSGKAKQLQLAASAQRNDSPNTLRNLAYSGVYELIFKNLLAYSDEKRAFISLLPDGTQREEVWSKYMFLSQDENGAFYYRDDFAWSVDQASEITQDRAAMWQMIDNDFLNGTLGTEIDPNRALIMYWQMKEQMGYPLAKYALAFLKEAQEHLPSDIEKALVDNPEAVQLALAHIQQNQQAQGLAGGRGGARPNSGPRGGNATHAANVERTNSRNRAQSGAGETTSLAEKTGGMQGGTGQEEVKR